MKRAMLLPVSAPFHCALMAPAADAMAEALAKAELRAPVVPVVANVTAAKASDPVEIRDLLVKQVTGTVRWRECVAAMAAMGCDTFVEVGAGKVLTGLMKRNAPEAGRQRQWRRPGGDLGRQGRGRARHRDRQGGRREARDAAARLRPLPLRPDGPRRGRDGRGAGQGRAARAGRAGGGQRHRGQGLRSGRDPRPAGQAGDGHGALARMRRRHGRDGLRHLRRGRRRQGADRSDEAQRPGGRPPTTMAAARW